MSSGTKRSWHKGQLTALAVWVVLMVPFLGTIATMLSQQFQSAVLAREGSDITRQVEQKVRQMHGLLNSLVSVHFATSGNSSALVAMAENLRQSNPKITAVGRYQNVPLFEREAFQEEMAESGLYGYRISDLVNNERVPSPLRENAIPISLLDPMTPALLPLLGTDLAAIAALQTRLSLAMGQDTTAEIALPEHWPAAGQLMVLQPFHRIRQAREEHGTSFQKNDGGYFLIIDPNAYLADVLDIESHSHVVGLSLALRKDDEDKLLASKRFSTEHLIGSSWFEPFVDERTFELGDSSLVLLIDCTQGIHKSHLVTAILFILLATACFIAILAWLNERDNAARELNALHIEDDIFPDGSAIAKKPISHGLRDGSITITASLLLLLPALCVIATMISQRYQAEDFAHAGSDARRMVEQKIRQMTGLFNSLVSAKYATSDDSLALIAMSEQLRLDYPKITAVGRYESVPIWNRNSFEKEAANYGPDGFFISELVNGVKVPSPLLRNTTPISLLEPMTSQLLPLVGTDLSADNTLQQSLLSAIVQNSSIVNAIPDDWPAARQLMVLQPAYRGLYAPENHSARIQQADGGYLLIIDPQVYLEGLVGDELQKSLQTLSLVLRKFGEETELAIRQLPTESMWFSGWFKQPLQQHTFKLGDASLVLSIVGTNGIPGSHMIAAMVFISQATALFVAAMLWGQERRRAAADKLLSHDALRTERDRTVRTLHLISDAVITVDQHCIIQHANIIGVQFLEFDLNELINKPLDTFLSMRYRDPPSDDFNALQLLRSMRSGEPVTLDLVCVNQEASPITFSSTVSLHEGSSTYPAMGVFVFRDVSAEKRLTAALEYQANHDALTGCANRRHFERCLGNLIDNRSPQSAGNALLFIDLDQFKIVNDTAGHAAGDMMLMHLAKELSHIIGSGDTLARLGGDEFGLLMCNVSSNEAEKLARSVHKLFQAMVFNYQDRGYPIRASLGLVHFDEAVDAPAEVLAAADMACYAAKDMGRDQLYVYHADDSAITRRTSELEWLSLLRQALLDNRFRLFAQPLVCIRNPGKVSRYEILLRLADDDGHELQASRIISAAERYGMMRDIDRWVINQTFSIVAEYNEAHEQSTLIFAINLSGQSAADSTLIDFIRERMLHYRIDPRHLCFEITETAAISHFSNAVSLSQAIRDMGAKIALDDFGSGLSSFAYLKNLPIDILKIDGQFIREIASNPIDQAMVRAIRDVASSMQITTVAEFVENQAILDVLTDIGIDIAQGFHIARPMPIERVLCARRSRQMSKPVATSS